MTNKQAIEIIRVVRKQYIPRTVYDGVNEALDLAIKAIEENERLCLLYSDMANEMARLKSMTGER